MIPADILAIAQATRATFGDKVKLLFVADERTGQTQGRAIWDDPCHNDDCRSTTPTRADP